jgi:hypothetical protein
MFSHRLVTRFHNIAVARSDTASEYVVILNRMGLICSGELRMGHEKSNSSRSGLMNVHALIETVRA